MADFEEKVELSEKPKSSIFNHTLNMLPVAQKAYLLSPSFNRVVSASNSIKGKVKQLCSLFESSKSPSLSLNESQLLSPVLLKSPKLIDTRLRITSSFTSSSFIRLPGTEGRIVVYLTSLRGIRRTYEDCYAVRMIFRGFTVWVDERDISMDLEYKKELQSVLGGKKFSLPQVFIKGKYVGGADVIKHLFEVGELAKLLDGIPFRKPGYVCESCGDIRFVPCTECSGSRKVYDEDEEKLNRCVECNENGLIRCPDCCI